MFDLVCFDCERDVFEFSLRLHQICGSFNLFVMLSVKLIYPQVSFLKHVVIVSLFQCDLILETCLDELIFAFDSVFFNH